LTDVGARGISGSAMAWESPLQCSTSGAYARDSARPERDITTSVGIEFQPQKIFRPTFHHGPQNAASVEIPIERDRESAGPRDTGQRAGERRVGIVSPHGAGRDAAKLSSLPALVMEHRRFLLRTGAYALLASILIALLIPVRYQSVTRLMPPDSQSTSGLGWWPPWLAAAEPVALAALRVISWE